MTVRQMTFEILLNPSVKGKDALRLSRQAERIYALLQRGPVKTSEMVAVALQYNARISEIRHALYKIGLMVDETECSGGEHEYHIVRLDQSTFWQRVKDKGETWKWTINQP